MCIPVYFCMVSSSVVGEGKEGIDYVYFRFYVISWNSVPSEFF